MAKGMNWGKVRDRARMTTRGTEAISSYPKSELRSLAKDIKDIEEWSRRRLLASDYHKPITSLPRKAKMVTMGTDTGSERPPWD